MFDASTRILITGGAGFIGSNLTEAFIKLGAKVRILDDFSSGTIANLSEVVDDIEIHEGDITCFDVCRKACIGIDYVLHHAALGSVPRSIEDPLSVHNVNVNGMINMLIAARDANIRKFVYASSSSVYGDEISLPKVEGREGDLLSPYAATKLICELYAKTFHTVYGLKTVGLRYFNVFGKRQDPDSIYAAVIPLFVKNILQNESPVIYGDGEQSRDFTHIDNVIDANIKACLSSDKADGDVFNIAYGGRKNLNDLCKKITTMLGKEIIPTYTANRQGDIKHSCADISKALSILNYNPKIDLEEGLKKSIEWYKENL